MTDTLTGLLSRRDVSMRVPALESDIDTVAKRFGGALPETLIRFWRSTNGLGLEKINAQILGPSEVLQWIDVVSWALEHGLLPLLDDNESNYVALFLRPPLAYRLAYVPHDDGSRLLYRDLNGFANDLLVALDSSIQGTMFFYDTKGDFPPDALRPHIDYQAARQLLNTDGANGEWNHACVLLDATNLSEWARLLETDHFVRRDAVARMQQMNSPAIRDLLQQDRIRFEEFAEKVAEAVRKEGLAVGERRRDVLSIGGSWYNLDSFFHRRKIQHAMPRMMDWIKDQLAGQNPYHRPGNFMAD